MYRVILFVCAITFYSFNAYSEGKIDFATVEAKTTEYCNSGKWDSVIYIGKIALENNIDYFFLRKRLGIAWFYKEIYTNAINEFEHALIFNSSDIGTQEFLYLCYILSGREEDARLISKEFEEQTQKDLNIKKNEFIKSISFETGASISNNFKKNGNTNFEGSNKIYGEGDLTNNIYYSHLGFKNNIGKRISIYYGLSFIRDEKQKIIQETSFVPGGRGIAISDTTYPMYGHTYYDTIYRHYQLIKQRDTTSKYKYTLKQEEYYINCNIQVLKGFSLTPFFHLLHIGFTPMLVNYSKNSFITTDTTQRHSQYYYNSTQYYDTVYASSANFHLNSDKYKYIKKDTSFYNYVVGMTLSKVFDKYTASLYGSYSNLNNYYQKEAGISLIWLTNGNLSLYEGLAITAFQQNNDKIKLISDVSLGIKIFPKIWLEGFGTYGEMSNYSEKNGFIVNNNPDKITFRCGVSSIFVFKHFDISLRYQYQEKESSYITYTNTENYITQNVKYQNHLIIGGIKWKL